jgi:hypothetical protein
VIETLAQVRGVYKGKPFTAGLVLWDNRVVEVAPILWRFRKRTRGEVRASCRELGWSASVVYEMQRPNPYTVEPQK